MWSEMGENTVPKCAELMEGVSLDRKLLSPPDYALYLIVPRLIDEIKFEPTIWEIRHGPALPHPPTSKDRTAKLFLWHRIF